MALSLTARMARPEHIEHRRAALGYRAVERRIDRARGRVDVAPDNLGRQMGLNGLVEKSLAIPQRHLGGCVALVDGQVDRHCDGKITISLS